MMTVYNLAGGDLTKYDAVFEQPWSYVQVTRMIRADLAHIQHNYNQIQKSKRKQG